MIYGEAKAWHALFSDSEEAELSRRRGKTTKGSNILTMLQQRARAYLSELQDFTPVPPS